MSGGAKLYIDNLVKKTIGNKKIPFEPIEQVSEPIKQADEKQSPPPYETSVTLEDILIPPLSPHAQTFEKEENEMDKIMETAQSTTKGKYYVTTNNDNKKTIDLKNPES